MSAEASVVTSLFMDFNPFDGVAARDSVNDFQAFGDLAEHGIPAIQMRLRRMRDEKLAAARVFARQSHPDRSANVRPRVHFAANLITRSAFAVSARITSLNDEVRDYAMKGQVVEITFARQRDEAVHSNWRVGGKEFHRDCAFVSVNRRDDSLVHPGGDSLVEKFVVASFDDADAV